MNFFKTFTLVLLGLLAGVGSAKAQEDVKIYFASLKAQSLPESTGSGQVKLTWVDITGAPMAVDLAKQLNFAAFQDPSWMMKEYVYDGFDNTAQIVGGTMSALDGMETMIATDDQIFMTSFVYYYAQAQPSNGSYLADWTFTDPVITKMTEPMGGAGTYIRMIGSTANEVDYNNPLISPCFKVLPDTVNNAMSSDQDAVGAMAYTVANVPGKYNNLYAVFNKYLLSNPQAENGHMNANESSAIFNVSVDVEGDASQLKADYADFDFPASNFVDNAEGTWSWEHDVENPIENISAFKKRYNFTITFTPKTTLEGRKNATLTIRMAHADPTKASTLDIPLSVDVRPAATADATLYDGKTPTTTSGSLLDMIAEAHNTDKIVVLNRDYTDALDVEANVTINLNGYDMTNSLTVSGGDVTIAYSKFGGKISSVNVASGKLTLNGGTIDASGDANVIAVIVASGATLIQNGATIKAKANTVMATGIEVNGNVEINDGVMTAHADMFGAFVANVKAGGKLIVNGGTLSATVNQSNNPTPQISDQSTWSNVYSVFVSSGTGEAEINGGTFNATSNYAGAFAVCGLASMGKLTVEKKAVVNAHSGCNMPTAYAVGLLSESPSINEADATINGGKFSATYMEGGSEVTPCPPFLCAVYKSLSFKSGYIKADAVYVRDENNFPMSLAPVNPTLYNIVRDCKDWNEGWRYIAVDESKTTTLEAGVPACRIGTVGYTKLEDALAYANNNPSEALVIFMTNDYVLPAGYYTLPEKATLVVPMSDSQEKEINMTAPRVIFNDELTETPYTSIMPTEFRRLTFANGVNMDLFGTIELTCSQYASNEAYTSQPVGPYGRLVMEEGSRMTLQNGSELRAWGFMTGKGETDARRGATVREMFQMGDWKGAMTSVKITGMVPADFSSSIGDDSDKKIFPVSQYFIQNIESPVKYHPGSLLSTSAAVSEGLAFLSVSMTAADIGLIGVSRENQGGEDDPAIFLMDIAADADNTWVRKWYDVENDIQVYEINSGAHIGSMVLDMGELYVPLANLGTVPIKLNSAKFDLPLTCNFKIHLLSGLMDFKQNTSLLPGAEVEVDKEATVSVAQNPSDKEHTGALYVYDADDWNDYAFGTYENGDAYAACTKTVRYSPSWNGRPTKRDEFTKVDAKINVHGTFTTATGFVYTSVGNGANSTYNPEGEPTGGANIFSSNEDAGTFIFNENASEAENPRKVYQVKTGDGNFLGRSTDYDSIPFYLARLKNGNGKYVNTDAAVAGDAYCYQNNEWSTMTVDEDDPCFMKAYNGNTDTYTYYAKPAEYVAVVATKETRNEGTEDEYKEIVGNEDHTFSDAAGAGRLFILISDPDCQWWEVENVDNLYHCIHPDNDTYYYWDNDAEEWKEKTFTITWKNWDDEIIETVNSEGDSDGEYIVTYGTMAEFLGTNPTRPADIDYTYDFTGWSPVLAPVTSNVTYTATYEAQPRMYTIIFQNEGGTEIERQFLTHNAVPVCENMPTKVGHILQWDPAISPVIKDQDYTATWLDEPPTEWDVTFVNNANGVLQATEKVAINAHPTYNKSTPVKENADHTPYTSDEYTYTFWGWSAVIDGVARQFAAGAELPCPTAPTTYTAVYTETQKTYVVRFLDENGVLIPGEEYNLPYGAMPVCSNTPTKENTAEWTYGFAWTPQIQTVMASVNPIEYQATFPATKNKYTVTLTSNLSGVCTFTGAGTFDYGTEITNVAVSYNDTKYTFDGWSDGETDADHPSFTLTGNITLTANFTPKSLKDKTIAKNETWTVDPDTEVKDLVLTSDGLTSGQIENVSNLTIRGNAYFDLALNAAAQTWYAFAVPWKVDATSGVSVKGGAQLILDNTYHVLYYDGANRAQYGKANGSWKFLADKSDKTLEPGTLYLIYLNSAANTLRFTKKNGASFNNISVMVEQYPSQTGDDKDANWNGIANPAVYYAYMNAGIECGQHYNGYPFEMSTHKFIVGEPIFVQTPAKKSVVADNSQYPASAPRRNVVPENDNKAYEIRIAPLNAEFADRIYVRPAEEKMDKYIIGKDLAKISVSTKAPQMWVNRYDAKLCVNTIEEVDNQATFPLGIYAPADGQYTISTVTPVAEDEELFITVNGAPVWNLAQGEYNIDLKAGNTDAYGLLLVRERQIPEVTTGCESVKVADKASIRKVLINGQVFIIRDGAVYTIFGQKAQ